MKKLIGIIALVIALSCLLVSCEGLDIESMLSGGGSGQVQNPEDDNKAELPEEDENEELPEKDENDSEEEEKEEETPEHTHEFGEWIVASPTCTEKGIAYRSCECGEEETVVSDAFGHDYAEGVCTICGETDPEYLPDTWYSEGLSFRSNGEGKCYVLGPGECTDSDIIIPEYSPEGDRVTEILAIAFMWISRIESVNIPDTVVNIGGNAFTGCTNLKSVVIGKNVTDIGHGAFQDCTSLTEVYYKGTAVEWESIEIGDINDILVNAVRYYYSEAEPTTEGNFWHYVNGVPTAWTVNAGEHEHIYSAIEVVVPTCEAGGYTVCACTCGDSYTVNHDALGHVKSEMHYVKNETGICDCEWTNPWWINCVLCATVLEEGADGAKGHCYTVREPIIPEPGLPLCDFREGYRWLCDNCDCYEHIMYEYPGVPRGHKVQEYTDAYIDGNNVIFSYVCDDCGTVVSKIVSIDELENYKVNPTCFEEGYWMVVYRYTVYGKEESISLVIERYAAPGHNFFEGACTACGERVIIGEHEHTPVLVYGYLPSCSDPGLTDGKKCSLCGEVLVEQLVIPAVGHNYGDGVDGASEFKVIDIGSNSYDAYWCEVCQYWVAYRVHQD